jgi:hypothetical protein
MIEFPTIFASVFIFVGFSLTSFVLLFFARKIHGKTFPLSWLIFAVGNELLGWSISLILLSISTIYASFFNVILVIMSTSMMVFGMISVLNEKYIQINKLKNRYKELVEILEVLKSKYVKREISEDELKDLHKSFVKEMTEIEVKIKELEKL